MCTDIVLCGRCHSELTPPYYIDHAKRFIRSLATYDQPSLQLGLLDLIYKSRDSAIAWETARAICLLAGSSTEYKLVSPIIAEALLNSLIDNPNLISAVHMDIDRLVSRLADERLSSLWKYIQSLERYLP